MTAAATSTDGQVGVERPDGPSTETCVDRLERKIREHVESATQALADQEFEVAFRKLDQLPDVRKTPAMRDLHRRCLELEDMQRLLEAAERCFTHEDYEGALAKLGQIPEKSRTSRVIERLESARRLVGIKVAFRQARHCFDAHDYDQAASILNDIPDEDHAEESRSLRDEANRRLARIIELDCRITSTWSEIETHPTSAACEEMRSLLEELVELQPGDDNSKHRLSKVVALCETTQIRDQLMLEAGQAVGEYEFELALAHLEEIPIDVRDDEVTQLLNRVTTSLSEIQRLSQEIVTAFEQRDFLPAVDAVRELVSLQPDGLKKIIELAAGEEIEGIMLDLAVQSQADSQLVGLLNQMIHAFKTDAFCSFLGRRGTEFAEHCSEDVTALDEILAELLASLPTAHLYRAQRLQALRAGVSHLRDGEPRLAAWEELETALTEFETLQNRSWGWWHRFVQDRAATLLLDAGRRLAIAADGVLDEGENRWDELKKLSRGGLNRHHRIVQRVHAMISQYLQTKKWPVHGAAPVRFLHIVIGAALVTATFGLQAALSPWLPIADGVGFTLILLQLVAMTAFYRTACKSF